MSIVRWDPWKELQDMSARLNHMFGDDRNLRSLATTGRESMTAADWIPSVDITETAEEYLIKAEIPEVKKEDVKVTVEHGVLRLAGERKQEKEEKGKKFHRVERYYGSFLRTFSLPENVDDAKLQAEFKEGVLTVRLPKSAAAKPKSVEVKVS